jgi:protein-S-isoprenylcysteine O-methyltransferase Ste14
MPSAGDSARDVGPGVNFPPPLMFVIGFGVGVALQQLWPLPIDITSNPWMAPVGGLLVLAGLTLAVVSIVTFRRARVSVLPNRPARSVVTHGVYAYSRNPIYLGFIAIYVGAVLMSGVVWALFMLPGVLGVLMRRVIRKEEAHLRERFPGEYADYCQRVRRWM